MEPVPSPFRGASAMLDMTSTAARGNRLAIIALAAIMALSLPALLIDLGRLAPRSWMEGIALLSSRETWKRQHAGESHAWLTPTVNGSPRLRKPPMLIWLNMLAWSDLDPATAPAET